MSRKSTVIKECTYRFHVGDRQMSLSDFYRNRTKSDGHSDICANCQAQVNIEARAARKRNAD